MNWSFIDGHCIPPEELKDHEAVDWCQCRPVPICDPNGTIWWRHNYFDNTFELLEAAENIKNAEGVKLHMNAELRGLKMQVYPYTASKIYLPLASHRKSSA